ncbi:hypothetical protein ACET3Z_023303 [Daucus carota]
MISASVAVVNSEKDSNLVAVKQVPLSTNSWRESHGNVTDVNKKDSANTGESQVTLPVDDCLHFMSGDFPDLTAEITGAITCPPLAHGGGLHDFSRIESASESEVIKIKSSAQQNRLLAGRPRRYCWRVGEGLKGINMREQAPREAHSVKCAVFQREKFSPLGISSPDGWEDE